MTSLQRGWVADGLPQFTGYFVLRREIEFLKQLRGNGDAAGRPDLPERSLGIVAVVEVLVISIAIWACPSVSVKKEKLATGFLTVAEILLQRNTPVWRGCC